MTTFRFKFAPAALLLALIASGGELARAETTRITETTNERRCVFTQDRSHVALGDAWRDPEGLLWGSLVRNDDNSVVELDFESAQRYCDSINARLPTQKEFERLRDCMGGEYDYNAQALPDLINEKGRGYQYWSSDLLLFGMSSVIFASDLGRLFNALHITKLPLRCVYQR